MGLKNAKRAVFHLKLHFAWRKSAIEFRCVKTVYDRDASYIGCFYLQTVILTFSGFLRDLSIFCLISVPFWLIFLVNPGDG